MKKLVLIMILLMFVLVLQACGKTDETTTEAEKDPTTIRFACWRDCGTEDDEENHPLVNAIRKYEEENPHVTVEILRAPLVPNEDDTGTVEQPWLDYLASLASADEFPDLFNAPNMPNALLQGWARDITDFVSEDEEFDTIYEDIRETGKFFEHYYAVPYMYEFFGYFINKTLFNEENVDYPMFGSTIDEFLTSAKSVARLQEGGNSVLGLSGPAEMFNYFPAQLNDDLGWYAWDASKQSFELDDPAFKDSIELNLEIISDKTYVNDALSEEERATYFGSADWWYPWWNGQLGIHFDFSNMFTFLINAKNKGDITFDFDFIGIPRGNDESELRTPIKPTYMMLGKDTEVSDEAFKLLKYLSYDDEGYAYKLEVSRNNEDVFPVISPPLTDSEIAHQAFFDDTYPDYPEWQKVIENGKFYFDAWAVMPGFEEARWLMLYQEGRTMADINHEIGNLGEEDIGDHAQEMKRLMNNKIAEVYDDLREKLGIEEE